MNIYGIFKSSVIFILDFIFKPSPIKLIRTKKSLLGPSNLQECIYTFHKQQYIVILDTLITNFNVFKTQLQNTPCINIPNRAIKSNTIEYIFVKKQIQDIEDSIKILEITHEKIIKKYSKDINHINTLNADSLIEFFTEHTK